MRRVRLGLASERRAFSLLVVVTLSLKTMLEFGKAALGRGNADELVVNHLRIGASDYWRDSD